MASFHDHIRQSLNNPNLQTALDANAEIRISVRREAFASLPDFEAMRARAKAVRREVITNLERYLEQFTKQLETNGIQVHKALDADQAVAIILGIAQKCGAKLIAKSKTMVSEEIELNKALEGAGLRVVETDLGEYIVQIRNEPPSHIITPAVHLRREDVGRTFHEVLGIPYTDDIQEMTTVARQNLRTVFLTADMGISGVNFGVAESGTLCLVTNEGNGRMVTTLPQVHVALMGMERLVPSMNDLALMLELLPRSATGQKLSVYTNLIHSPRRPSDPDGPSERHVVILDNGRSKIRDSHLSEILYCIRCGACLNACPVFREIGGHAYVGASGMHTSYPGPVGSVLSPALFGHTEYSHLARASSLCGACKEACPVDIDLPKLLLRVRAGEVDSGKKHTENIDKLKVHSALKPNTPLALSIGLRIFAWIATSPSRFALGQRLAGVLGHMGVMIYPKSNGNKNQWLSLPAFTGWGLSKDFPTPARQSFHQRWANLQAPSESVSLKKVEKRSTSLQKSQSANTSPNTLEVFRNEITTLGGTILECGEEDIANQVLNLLAEYQAKKVLAWEDEYLPKGLLDSVYRSGVEVIHPTIETNSAWNRVKVGLTAAIAGIADSGTLLLPGGKGRSLIASLLPDVHIAILYEKDLYAHLPDVINMPALMQASSAVLISGPSRTADIEMTLTIGVHGPSELIVIYVNDNVS